MFSALYRPANDIRQGEGSGLCVETMTERPSYSRRAPCSYDIHVMHCSFTVLSGGGYDLYGTSLLEEWAQQKLQSNNSAGGKNPSKHYGTCKISLYVPRNFTGPGPFAATGFYHGDGKGCMKVVLCSRLQANNSSCENFEENTRKAL